jgi:hypothetical protein
METNAVPGLPVPTEAVTLTWEFLVPVVVPVVVALIRRYIPTMPKLVVVLLAVVLGVGSIYLLNLSGWLAQHNGGYFLPIIIGVAAIGVREIFKQVLTALGWYPKPKAALPKPPDDSGLAT